jgi:perosamine synthetase
MKIRENPIVMFHPDIPESAIEKVSEILRGRWIGQGPKVNEFEKEFEKKFNLKNCVSLNSGTSALHLALSLSGVNPGDEVITTAQTCTATNHPILAHYATPIFSDIQYHTANIHPEDIEKKITPKTKAIIAVHWAGYPCDLKEINEIAHKHNIPVIEDAAHAVGAEYQGKPIGAISDFTCFSFQAIKQLTTVDGGMLVVKDNDLYEAAIRRRWYGIDKKKIQNSYIERFDNSVCELGYKFHMNDVTATIGLEQLKVIDEKLKRRQNIVNFYRNAFENHNDITLFENKSDRKSGNWLFSMHVNKRDDFAELLKKHNIECSVVHTRNDKLPIFGGKTLNLPNTAKLSESMISIPLHTKLTDEEIEYIIETINLGW